MTVGKMRKGKRETDRKGNGSKEKRCKLQKMDGEMERWGLHILQEIYEHVLS